MAKVSIVIPVYNKGKYLKETLSSVDKQLENDLEVIIIDDASTDNSFDIINDFVSNTKKQTKVIKNDTNMGVAYSRNMGIEESKADYVTFLDADDVLDDSFMEVMLDKAKKFPLVDFIRGSICPFTLQEGYYVDGQLEGFYEEQIIIPSYNPDYIYEEIVSCNGRLYKSDFVKNLRFIESCFEDYEFSLDTIINSTSILYTNKAQYNYRIINDGRNMKGLSNFVKSFSDYEEIYDRILGKYPNMSFQMTESIRKKQLYLYFNYLSIILGLDMSLIDRIDIIENFLLYLNSKYKLPESDVISVLGKPISSDISPDELSEKIKKILIKY